MSKVLTIGKPQNLPGVFVALVDLERDLNRTFSRVVMPPAGQIGGSSSAPTILGITESGGTQLSIGAIADGQMLKRVGTTIVGV